LEQWVDCGGREREREREEDGERGGGETDCTRLFFEIVPASYNGIMFRLNKKPSESKGKALDDALRGEMALSKLKRRGVCKRLRYTRCSRSYGYLLRAEGLKTRDIVVYRPRNRALPSKRSHRKLSDGRDNECSNGVIYHGYKGGTGG
jgi:hypothetical protein